MSKKEGNTEVKEKKKRGCWGKCLIGCLITFIITLVLFLIGAGVGLGIADNLLKKQFGTSVWDAISILWNVSNGKEADVADDPATETDNKNLYSELRGVLFLGNNADLENILLDYLSTALNNTDQQDPILADKNGENGAGDMKELSELISKLYAEGNIDLTRLRGYIENDVDIASVYSEEFLAEIEGNYFVKLINKVLVQALESKAETASFASSLSVRQITIKKNADGVPVVKLAIRIAAKNVANQSLGAVVNSPEMPGFAAPVINMAMGMVPANVYGAATLTLGDQPEIDFQINKLKGKDMDTVFKIINSVMTDGTDVKDTISQELKKAIDSLKESAPIVMDVINSADEKGKIKLDVYGMIGDAMGGEQPLEGEELVKFLVGALGSDDEIAIRDRIEEDPRYGEEGWEEYHARNLVSNMAASFSLADNYFVNGTDASGNKIISVEEGIVTGVDKLLGRVYSDAMGNLYYKMSGGRNKIFISPDKNVSLTPKTGYETFLSTNLNYTQSGKNYILYKSMSGETIYGVNGTDVQDKNGAYTELTTLYVDADGNVYSAQNATSDYIEVTKEKLTVDSIMNMIGSETLSAADVLQYLDVSALKLNGVSSWLEPITIKDIELVAMLGGMLDEYLTGDLKNADIKVAYAKIEKTANADLMTIGFTLSVKGMLPGEDLSFITNLIGERLYLEAECDITLGRMDDDCLPTKLRFNDLNDDYTEDLLKILQKFAADVNLNGEIENAVRQIRKTLNEMSQTAKFTIENGGINFACPADIILPLLEVEVDKNEFVKAVNLLLRSDSDVALDVMKEINPAFADVNWKQEGVNQFVETFSDAFLFKKESFLSTDGVNYSAEKIVDIMTTGSLSIDALSDYLDYAEMQQNGFSAWKEGASISDLQLAALVDSLKGSYLADFADMDLDIVYADLLKNEKELLTLGVTVNKNQLLSGENLGDIEVITDCLGEIIYVEIEVDVTQRQANPRPAVDTSIKLNDLTEQETETLLNLLYAIAPEMEEQMFSTIGASVCEMLSSLEQSVALTIGNGEIQLEPAQNLIFDVAMTSAPEDFTPDKMTDALTVLAKSGKTCADANGNFVVDTSLDAQHENFWNGVLNKKYFVTTEAGELFGAITSGEDVYNKLMSDLDKDAFVTADGSYAHASAGDAEWKANGSQFSWLFRSNQNAIASMMEGSGFEGLKVYKADVLNDNGKARFDLVITIPASSIIANIGSMNAGIKDIITNILGETVAMEFSWTKGETEFFTINGMDLSDEKAVDDLVYAISGHRIFDADSEIAHSAHDMREKIDEFFTFGVADGKGYATMNTFYELIAENVFPATEGKENITKNDVYELMKTIYVLPETNGAFDSNKVGYVNQPATLNEVKAYVNGDNYHLVGAKQNLAISPLTAQLDATVAYLLNDVDAMAGQILPSVLYITVFYDANPTISGMNVSVANSVMTAKYNMAASDAAVVKCMKYLGHDMSATVAAAHTQLDNYILSTLSIFG